VDARVIGVLLAAAMSTGACTGNERAPVQAALPIMPHAVGLNVAHAALAQGTLVQDGRCLYIESGVAQSSGRLLLVWPKGFRAVSTERGTAVADASGAVVAVVGSQVTFGGGEISVTKIVVRPDVSRLCKASVYWVVGQVVASGSATPSA
jgi:hypothetical protein